MMQSNYQDSITNLQTQWFQADLDQRAYLGDTSSWGQLYPDTTITHRRAVLNFNIIHSTIMVVTGHQRRNRKSTIAIPVHSPVQKTADQFTKCLYYVNGNGGYETISDAYEQGALVQGFGLIFIYPDFTTDPVSPEIKTKYIDMKSIIIDPYFRNKDLSDCRYIWMRQFFGKEEAKLMYPKLAEEIENTPTGGSFKDDKFYYMPENFGFQQTDLLAMDEYWYLSQRTAIYVIDNETEETKEVDGDEEDIRIIQMEFGDRIRIVKRPKQTIRRAIVINGRVAVDEERPFGLDFYPFAGTYGNFNPDAPNYAYKFKGIVRDIRDINYLFDLRKTADLDILESQQQGLIVEDGSLLNPDDSLNRGNGRVLVRRKGSSPDSITPMQIIPPSQVMLEMEQMLMDVSRVICGVNEELLGAAVDDKAGVLSMLRQGAGLTTLQKYTDNLEWTQKRCGEIIISLIQNYWSYGKIKQVIGEEPTPEFDNKAFFKYGAKVVQGVLTDTQQQLELAQLFELQQRFGEVFPADEIIEVMTIQNKDRIIEKIQKAQQEQAQQAQQMQEIQMKQMEVDMQTKLSYSKSQEGLAAERVAKIQTDVAVAEDKIKRAHTEDTAALLNVIKAIKELEGMNLNELSMKLALLDQIQPEMSITPTLQQEPQQNMQLQM